MEQVNLRAATKPDQERGRPPRQLDEVERLPPVLAPNARPVPVERIDGQDLAVNHELTLFAAVDDADLAREARPASEGDSRPLDPAQGRSADGPMVRGGLRRSEWRRGFRGRWDVVVGSHYR